MSLPWHIPLETSSIVLLQDPFALTDTGENICSPVELWEFSAYCSPAVPYFFLRKSHPHDVQISPMPDWGWLCVQNYMQAPLCVSGRYIKSYYPTTMRPVTEKHSPSDLPNKSDSQPLLVGVESCGSLSVRACCVETCPLEFTRHSPRRVVVRPVQRNMSQRKHVVQNHNNGGSGADGGCCR